MAESELYTGIIKKGQELNRKPDQYLKDVLTIVAQLEGYLEGKNEIDKTKLTSMVSKLTSFTIMVPISMVQPFSIVRAVKFDPQKHSPESFENTSRLSYISKNSGIIPSLGRLNGEGKSLFYATYGNDFTAYSAVMSELRASVGQEYRFIWAEKYPDPQKIVNLIPIGLFDYFRRGTPDPFRVSDEYFKIYNIFCDYTHPDGVAAVNLCDAFLTKVLKQIAPQDQAKADRLYHVTSTIAEDCLQAPFSDGIIYPSTKYEGYPNIALKPESVNKHFFFREAAALKIDYYYGHGIYKLNWLGTGEIKREKIEWNINKERINRCAPLNTFLTEAFERQDNSYLMLGLIVPVSKDDKKSVLPKSWQVNVNAFPLNIYQSMGKIRRLLNPIGVHWDTMFAEIIDGSPDRIKANDFSDRIHKQFEDKEIIIPFYDKNGNPLNLKAVPI